jgi:putative ABC transport system ATP-binding protein
MPSKKQAFVSVEHLSKSFSNSEGNLHILKNLSFEIGTSEVVAIIGPSGSGKTTLLNIISGIDLPSDGKVRIGNTDITKLSDDERSVFRAKNLGFVFQDFLLLDHLTVGENILLPIQMNGIEPRFTLDEILERVGLLSKKNSKIDILSR